MTLLLAGDIGGTKTILRLVEAETIDGKTKLKPLYENRYASAEFLDLVPLVRKFLVAAELDLVSFPKLEKACFAVAGPVVNNTSRITNLPWSLSGERLQEELLIDQVSLINDFEAVGYGVLGLEPADLETLQVGELDPEAPIAVIGAGTGLGQGFLMRQGDGYRIYPSEGGHADFAPRSELEFQLMRYLLEKHKISRVSVERVVSGQGIVSVYQFLRDRYVADESPMVAELIRTWEGEMGISEKTVDPAAVIAKAAAEGDRLSSQTMELFASAYGAEAGNLALKLLPYGGLYLAGGIAAKNLALMKSGIFLEAFTAKGRVSPLIERVPVHVITNPNVGLIGAAICAARL
ncbi:glucokinase [Oscillatoria sp. FACHB-1407]|uniref:glucokinase n=1 Tax=Oscillatoria sp. FACHB-1407 TaxID=2692847 RepID=UPI001686D9E8|nr:glucokinase [Oscillatoria sp. FACHB-1407]MBD2462562.1 glucokinase [Oscillatoria sp. FACHB-1407]